MFDLRRILPKYLRTFLHENAALTIGITDQSDYSICYFMVRLLIHTVYAFIVKGAVLMEKSKIAIAQSMGDAWLVRVLVWRIGMLLCRNSHLGVLVPKYGPLPT